MEISSIRTLIRPLPFKLSIREWLPLPQRTCFLMLSCRLWVILSLYSLIRSLNLFVTTFTQLPCTPLHHPTSPLCKAAATWEIQVEHYLLQLVEHLEFCAEFSQTRWFSEVAFSENSVHESVMCFCQEVYLNCDHELKETLNRVVWRVSSSKSWLWGPHVLLVMVTKEVVEGSEDLRKIVSDGSVVHPQFFEKRLTHFAQRVFRYFLVCQIAEID